MVAVRWSLRSSATGRYASIVSVKDRYTYLKPKGLCFLSACDELSGWRNIASSASSGWHLVRSIDDIEIARSRGKVGLIMGFQNLRPIEDKLDRLAFFHDAGIR